MTTEASKSRTREDRKRGAERRDKRRDKRRAGQDETRGEEST